MGNQALQLFLFSGGQFAVFADGELAELDIHDAHPVQLGDLVIQEFAHPADLAVQSLGENDAKGVGPQGFDRAFFGHRSQDGKAVAHAVDEFRGDGRFDGDDVLLVVFVAGAQDLVDDIAIVGQEDQPLGGFVQSADGEEAFLVTDEGDDVLRFLRVGGTDDPYWFVEGEVEGFGFGFQRLAIDADHIAGRDTVTGAGGFVVDGDPTGVDQAVGFAAGADAGLADVLVEADRIVVGGFQIFCGIEALKVGFHGHL